MALDSVWKIQQQVLVNKLASNKPMVKILLLIRAKGSRQNDVNLNFGSTRLESKIHDTMFHNMERSKNKKKRN